MTDLLAPTSPRRIVLPANPELLQLLENPPKAKLARIMPEVALTATAVARMVTGEGETTIAERRREKRATSLPARESLSAALELAEAVRSPRMAAVLSVLVM